MKMNSQRMLIGIEKCNIAVREEESCHTQPVSAIPDLVTPMVQQPFEAMMDLESTRLMEERYGIREEGLF